MVLLSFYIKFTFSYFCPSLFTLCFMCISAIWVLCNILYVFYGYALLNTCGLCFSLLYLLNLLQAREMLAVLDKFPHGAIKCIMSYCMISYRIRSSRIVSSRVVSCRVVSYYIVRLLCRFILSSRTIPLFTNMH